MNRKTDRKEASVVERKENEGEKGRLDNQAGMNVTKKVGGVVSESGGLALTDIYVFF